MVWFSCHWYFDFTGSSTGVYAMKASPLVISSRSFEHATKTGCLVCLKFLTSFLDTQL